jgi:hypothetical protein
MRADFFESKFLCTVQETHLHPAAGSGSTQPQAPGSFQTEIFIDSRDFFPSIAAAHKPPAWLLYPERQAQLTAGNIILIADSCDRADAWQPAPAACAIH